MEVYGRLSSDAFDAEAFFKSIGEFVGVFAGAFAIGSLFGIVTAFVSFGCSDWVVVRVVMVVTSDQWDGGRCGDDGDDEDDGGGGDDG